jgi:hypothetical protein
MVTRVRTAVFFLLLPWIATSLSAEQKAGAPRPDAYGTQNWTVHRIGAPDFTPYKTPLNYDTDGAAVYSTDPNGFFHASVHIPSGGLLTYFLLDYCDNVAGGTVIAWLRSSPHNDPGNWTLLSTLVSTTQVSCTSAYDDLTAKAYTVNENANDLFVEVETKGGNSGSSFSGVSIYYQLQVSPPPATATFADVPTNHPFYKFIEALAKAGITKGCGASPLIFCPNQTITRGEAATWLAKALGLEWHP